jgi:hypothetical protein
MISHFILTRFNETYPEAIKEMSLNEDWLRLRIKLFKELTLPSVESQTDQDFHWLVKFHPETPNWVKRELEHKKITPDYRICEKVESLLVQRRMYESHFIRKYPCNRMICRYYFQNTIQSLITPETTKIITTSLDSDDGLSYDHIRTVKEHAVVGKFFDFSKGIARITSGDEAIHRIYAQEKVSPFYSYCERPSGSIRTFFYLPHHHVGADTHRINEVGWIQCFHDQNVLNTTSHLPDVLDNVDAASMRKFPNVRF